MKADEGGIVFWEICLSISLLLGWVGVVAPFVGAGSERVERLERTVRTYERLQGEVVRNADEPGMETEMCDGSVCLPTL